MEGRNTGTSPASPSGRNEPPRKQPSEIRMAPPEIVV
jgi:hypothetical protein